MNMMNTIGYLDVSTKVHHQKKTCHHQKRCIYKSYL